jgi:hypothetical protein
MSTNPPIQTRPTGDRREELERIKAATWPEEGKEERIRRALETLDNLPKWDYPIDHETLKWIVESPDLEDVD